MTQVVLDATANHGRVNSSSATYLTARSGGALVLVIDTGAAPYRAGQRNPGATFHCDLTYLEFDLSGIPAGATIDAATFSKVFDSSSFSAVTIVEVRPFDYGAAVTTADWVAGATYNGLALLASISSASITNGARNNLTSTAALLTAIAAAIGGTFRVVVGTDRFASATAPVGTSNQYGQFRTPAYASGDRPRLTIDYTSTEAHSGSATLTGAGVATPVGAKGGQVAQAITGGGVVVQTRQKGAQLAQAITASGSATSSGAKAGQLAAILTASGVVAVSGSHAGNGTGTGTGSGAAAAGGAKGASSAAVLTGAGAAWPEATTARFGSTTGTGGGVVTVTATGGAPEPPHTGTAELTGGGVVTVSARGGRLGAAILTASGSATTATRAGRRASAAITGSGSASSTSTGVHSSTARITGAGVAAFVWSGAHSGSATLTGGGTSTVMIGKQPGVPTATVTGSAPAATLTGEPAAAAVTGARPEAIVQ